MAEENVGRSVNDREQTLDEKFARLIELSHRNPEYGMGVHDLADGRVCLHLGMTHSDPGVEIRAATLSAAIDSALDSILETEKDDNPLDGSQSSGVEYGYDNRVDHIQETLND